MIFVYKNLTGVVLRQNMFVHRKSKGINEKNMFMHRKSKRINEKDVLFTFQRTSTNIYLT